jgi:hypothetical protein
VVCLVDAENARICSESDVEWLLDVDSAVINRVFEVVRNHAGVSDEDVEKMAKNSGPTGTAEQPIDSPPLSAA